MADQNNNQQDLKELISETLQLMQLSSMEEDERNMWTVILPSMQKDEIEKLKNALEKEVKTMTNIYYKAKEETKD